jgi:phage recombination protein Bet
MSTEVVKQEQKQVVQVSEQDIKDFLFGSETKLTPEQQVLFIKTAVAFNLNPLKREIYAVPYQERSSGKYRLSIVTGYEVYLKRAERLAILDGWKVWTEDGNDGKPIKAKIVIYRRDWKNPFEHEVYFKEYAQQNKMWDTKPHTMIKKVVTAQGFRMAFPDEMGGLPYTSDELPEEMTVVKPLDPNRPLLPATLKLKSIPNPQPEVSTPAPKVEETAIIATVVEDPHVNDILYIKYVPNADPNYYTEAQHDLILKLLDSHCLTPLQKLKYRKILKEKKMMSKAAGDLLNWLTYRIKIVKKSEDNLKEMVPNEPIRRKIAECVIAKWMTKDASGKDMADDTRVESFANGKGTEEDYIEIKDFLSDITEDKNVDE